MEATWTLSLARTPALVPQTWVGLGALFRPDPLLPGTSVVNVVTDPVDAEKQRFFPIPKGPSSRPLGEAPRPALCRALAAPRLQWSVPGPGALPSPQHPEGEAQESRGTGPRPGSLCVSTYGAVVLTLSCYL